jgi:very-short-patch-repair endonuclease
MARRGEVLVAILRSHQDFAIAREQNWYRIPVDSAQRLLKDRWPPTWLAFYQTKAFGDQAYAVNYLCKVTDIRIMARSELLPDEPKDERSERLYHKIAFDRLSPLQAPIPSQRFRRFVFIPTTLRKLKAAAEINDLFDDSPLENKLWSALKAVRISAERQELVRVQTKRYYLDFAIYCAKGKLDVETDGDTWHATPEKAPLDNLRDNDLHSAGWSLLRFNTLQVREQLSEYCVPKIADTVNELGGIDEGKFLPRRAIGKPGESYQMGLFEPPNEGRTP